MFIKTFKQISKADAGLAGGKGASLGELNRAGFSVPPGFVVLAPAFDRFLKETELNLEIDAMLKKINHKDINSINRASEEIRGLIAAAEMPKILQQSILDHFDGLKTKFVAVSSSATAEDSKTASWAGELETFLNVQKKDVISLVKKCWSSLFTPRAIFYRFEKKLQKQKISVAVVVQKMAQSQVSGICFTVHPVTKDKNQMVIEAGFGLGEAIVSGQITPDTYVLQKNNFAILDVNISEQSMMLIKTPSGNKLKKLSAAAGGKQKLAAKQIMTLAKICGNIEKHYGEPQDIEWAMEKGKFYITQSRPITTL